MEPTQQFPNQPMPPAPNPMREASKKGWKNIASTLAIILIAPILAIFITIFVFQSYEVYGMSMETTLQDGDRLIVQKLSKNWSRIRGQEYIPQRHEIVVFDKPSFLSNTSNDVDHLIKRVIALPGERVVLQNGKYTVYNQENPQGFDPDEGQEYAKDILNTPGEVDITVDQGEIFVSGDNRSNSLDSRNFGSINANTVTGIATIRFVPVNAFRRL
jgi:signal peptidase I